MVEITKRSLQCGSLTDRCFQSLRQQQVDAVDLTSCLMAINVRLQDIHEEVLDSKEFTQVNESTTLQLVWRKLTKYCNFLNYELLKRVICIYGPKSLKDDMEAYVKDLQMFRKKTLLRDLVEYWPRLTPPPKDEFRGAGGQSQQGVEYMHPGGH